MKKIAIIGSGMAGLAVGYIFRSNGYEVVLYEAQNSLNGGMDAHSYDLNEINAVGNLDIPLRIMNPAIWKSVLSLARHLAVPTFEVQTGLTYFHQGKNPWFRSGSLSFFNFRIPYISWKYWNSDTWKILKGILWLRNYLKKSEITRTSNSNINKDSILDQDISIMNLFERSKLDPVFWKGFLLPILVTICTCKEEVILNWPAHDLIKLTDRLLMGKNSLRFLHGTSSLVKALLQDVIHHSNTKVTNVQLVGDQVKVEDNKGGENLFDYCFVATQANQTSFLDSHQFKLEQEILSSFSYEEGELFVHTDLSFLPKNRKDWSALNYQIATNLETSEFTVWVNAVEPSIPSGTIDIFQTWNPKIEPKKETILKRIKMQRAIVTNKNKQAIGRLNLLHLEKDRRLFFVGSWASPGIPLLESAVQSSIQVAKILGLKIPWVVKK